MSSRTSSKKLLALLISAFSLLALAGCAPAESEVSAPTASDVWVKAVPELMDGMGMTGVFMTLENTSSEDVYLTGAVSATDGLTEDALEVHEVVKNDSGEMVMQEVEGKGIPIPAQGTVELKPGGYHIMFTSLLMPIEVGSTIEITLEFSNGTTRKVEAVAREIANANEKYTPETDSMDMNQ